MNTSWVSFMKPACFRLNLWVIFNSVRNSDPERLQGGKATPGWVVPQLQRLGLYRAGARCIEMVECFILSSSIHIVISIPIATPTIFIIHLIQLFIDVF